MTPRQIESALSRAQLICKMRGARLTPVRRRVLELILSSDQPAGAYALLAELRRGRGKLGPPTVYRALEFLLANKLIHKVETSSAFIACADIEHPHESQFMICDDCGATEELRDDEIVQSLRRLGGGQGFCRRAASHRGARTVPRLPLSTAVSAPERVLLGRVRDLLERDLLEQSVTERLARAAFGAALLWLAIYWALS